MATGALVHPNVGPFRLEGRSGIAYVLVHGFTGNAGHFRPLAHRLAETRQATVVAPLLPGHGRTIDDLRSVGRREWTEAVVDSVREVGDHRAIHLVGLSMGGHLAILAATRTSVASITTINTPVVFRDRRIRFARYAAPFLGDRRWSDQSVPELDDEVRQYWIHADGFPLRAAAELFSISREGRRAASTVTVPALVIQSRGDDTTHPISGLRLHAAFGGPSRLVWLDSEMHNALFAAERDVVLSEVLAWT